MNKRFVIFFALPALVVGIMLIIARANISLRGVVVTGGILFVAAGILNLIFSERNRAKRRRVVTTALNRVSSAAAFILGLSMLVFVDTFTSIVPFTIGTAIGLLTAIHLAYLDRCSRLGGISRWWDLSAFGTATASAYLYTRQSDGSDDTSIMLVTGIVLIYFALSVLTTAAMCHPARTAAGNVPSVPTQATLNSSHTAAPRALDEGTDDKNKPPHSS